MKFSDLEVGSQLLYVMNQNFFKVNETINSTIINKFYKNNIGYVENDLGHIYPDFMIEQMFLEEKILIKRKEE